jgi:nucleotide-binding universal stress UspA family protein
MNNRRDLEERLRNAPFHADVDASRARLSELLEQWDRSIGRPGKTGGLGRHIMRSTTGRLVAAVIVLVLVGAGIIRFGSHGGGIALGDIVKSMQRVPWVHVTGTVQSPQKNGHVEQWESFDRRIIVWVEPDGVITYRDAGAERAYVYRPQTNTITIIPATDRYDAAGPGSPVAAVEGMIARQKEAGAHVTYDAMTYNGVPARRIHIIAREEDMTLICDRDTGLPVSMESIATLPETSEQAVASATFEYPAEGPADIYALGAPRDAKVIDNRPQGSAADLVEQVQRRLDAGFEDHIAVMLESYVDGALEPAQIVVMWQQGRQKRMGRYHAYNFGDRRPEMATLYPAIKDIWPNLTVAEVLGLISDKFAEYQLIFDGTTSTSWSNFDQVRVDTIKTDLFQGGLVECLAHLARPDPRALMMTGSKLEVLPADPNHPGLVGFRIVTRPSDSSGHLPGTTTKARVQSYWFDPAKDYLLIEESSCSEQDEGVSQFVTTAAELGQTPAGKWYPTKIRIASSYPGRDGQIHHNTREQRILLDTSPVFEPGTFDAAALRSGQSAAR